MSTMNYTMRAMEVVELHEERAANGFVMCKSSVSGLSVRSVPVIRRDRCAISREVSEQRFDKRRFESVL